jgi:hypothetical protein
MASLDIRISTGGVVGRRKRRVFLLHLYVRRQADGRDTGRMEEECNHPSSPLYIPPIPFLLPPRCDRVDWERQQGDRSEAGGLAQVQAILMSHMSRMQIELCHSQGE